MKYTYKNGIVSIKTRRKISNLRSKPFYVILLLLQHTRRYKQREITILDIHFLNLSIKEGLRIHFNKYY